MTLSNDARRDPFRWLLDVGAALVASTSAHDSLQRMAAAIGQAMNVSQVDIQSLDRERGVLVQEATWDREGLSKKDVAFIGSEIPLDESPGFSRVVAGRQMDETHVDDPGLTDGERAAFVEWGYKATLDAPLVVGDEVVGVLGVTESRYVRRFMGAERERFEQLAALAAAAIRNMRIAAHERAHSERLAVVLELTGLLADGDPDGAARAAADGCLRQLHAARAAVYELGSEDGPTLLVEARDTPTVDADPEALEGPPEALAATVAAADVVETSGESAAAAGGEVEEQPVTGCGEAVVEWSSLLEQRRGADPLVVVHAAACESDDPLKSVLEGAGEAAWLAVPLTFLSRTLGWLVIAWRDEPRALDDDPLAFAIAVGEQLATGLENRRLVVETGIDGAGTVRGEAAGTEALLETEKDV